VDLSFAHAGARFFGVQAKYSIADQVLATVLNDPNALSSGGGAALQGYSDALEGVCVAPAVTEPLGPAQVLQGQTP
jgi:hypothetical protein